MTTFSTGTLLTWLRSRTELLLALPLWPVDLPYLLLLTGTFDDGSRILLLPKGKPEYLAELDSTGSSLSIPNCSLGSGALLSGVLSLNSSLLSSPQFGIRLKLLFF